jgi:heat shock protein HslJ
MKKILISIGILILLGLGIFVIDNKKGFVNDNFNQSQTSTTTNKQNIKSQEDLYGEWSWNSSVDALGKSVSPEDPSRFILTLDSSGKLTSTTDCNSTSGSFIKNQESLSIGALTSTEMACMGKTLELVYLSQLSQVSSYEISENKLTLNLIKDFGTMTFFRK